MGEFRTVCRVTDLADGIGRTVWVGDHPIAVFQVGADYFAIDDTCPHMGASLGSGFVEEGCVTCPWHFWRFRLADGAWADNPRIKIGNYPVRIVNDEIQIQFPDPPEPPRQGE
jgi:nitrite reductase (NADH) small subunit/3-phenylpropionate/trans-cinnamate dioxygenase ferredoxin subunit